MAKRSNRKNEHVNKYIGLKGNLKCKHNEERRPEEPYEEIEREERQLLEHTLMGEETYSEYFANREVDRIGLCVCLGSVAFVAFLMFVLYVLIMQPSWLVKTLIMWGL